MSEVMSLREAIQRFVPHGASVALEGFTHLIPFGAGHEVIRQGIRDLTLIRMTPDLIYDQLIGAGCARKLVFSWGGNPGVGSLHRFRDAVENQYPRALALDERSHAAMAVSYAAGAAGMPCGILRGLLGTDLVSHNLNLKFMACPFTGERLAVVPAIRPDVAIIHAQRADRAGNVHLWGIVGVQKEIALASKAVIVTVEEIVEECEAPMNACVLPAWVVNAVCHVPGGAAPSYAHGYYERNNEQYKTWDAISRDRATFEAWIQDHVFRQSVA